MAFLNNLTFARLFALFLVMVMCFSFTVSVESESHLTGPWPKAPTPPKAPSPPKPPKRRLVRCTDKKYIFCYLFWQLCPLECPTSCMLDCVACKPVCSCNFPGAVCQDPRFVGGDGIAFYFHGKKDKDFCLVSDENLQINGHFIGKRNPDLKRDFTWVQSIGILFGSHKLSVGAKKTPTWNKNVDHLTLSFDGKPISLPTTEGASWQPSNAPHVMLTRTTDMNRVTVEVTGSFKVMAAVVPITMEESIAHGYNISENVDCFAHLELGFRFYRLSDNVDGVLGQTYRKDYVSRAKMGVLMPVLGGNDKFSSSHIFATDCAASRFVGGDKMNEKGVGAEYAKLQCKSGMQGNGIVCKK